MYFYVKSETKWENIEAGKDRANCIHLKISLIFWEFKPTVLSHFMAHFYLIANVETKGKDEKKEK